MSRDHPNEPLNVLICHGAPLVSAGIAALLRDLHDVQAVLPEHTTSAPWRHHDCHVVVADYSSGVNCARDLAALPAAQCSSRRGVLVVTAQASEWEIRHAIACGVRGYLLADCEGQALQQAVRAVARGARCFDEMVSSRMAESLVHATLTPREHEVLRLLASGCANKVIAQRLGIAVGTVKAHIKAILEKMQVRTRMQAAALATERGMLRVPPAGATGAVQRSRTIARHMSS
jgi:DNA-binding NarL/FixJ family response regulator